MTFKRHKPFAGHVDLDLNVVIISAVNEGRKNPAARSTQTVISRTQLSSYILPGSVFNTHSNLRLRLRGLHKVRDVVDVADG